MRLLTIILTITWQTTLGQVGHSIAIDKRDVLKFSVDTLIQELDKVKKIDRIVIKCDSLSFNALPKIIRDREIVKYSESKKGKAKDIRNNDIVIKVMAQGLVQGQLRVFMVTFEKRKNGLGFFAGGGYNLFYDHLSGTDYKLTRVESGIVM